MSTQELIAEVLNWGVPGQPGIILGFSLN